MPLPAGCSWPNMPRHTVVYRNLLLCQIWVMTPKQHIWWCGYFLTLTFICLNSKNVRYSPKQHVGSQAHSLRIWMELWTKDRCFVHIGHAVTLTFNIWTPFPWIYGPKTALFNHIWSNCDPSSQQPQLYSTFYVFNHKMIKVGGALCNIFSPWPSTDQSAGACGRVYKQNRGQRAKWIRIWHFEWTINIFQWKIYCNFVKQNADVCIWKCQFHRLY